MSLDLCRTLVRLTPHESRLTDDGMEGMRERTWRLTISNKNG